MIRECTIEDTDFIDMVSKHPENWDKVTSDTKIPPEDFTVAPVMNHPDFHFMKAIDNGEAVGSFLYITNGSDTAECHVCFLPKKRKHTKELGEEFINWVFTNTNIKVLRAKVKCDRKDVLNYVKRTGFQLVDLWEKSFLKNGIWHDQYIYEIKKEVR